MVKWSFWGSSLGVWSYQCRRTTSLSGPRGVLLQGWGCYWAAASPGSKGLSAQQCHHKNSNPREPSCILPSCPEGSAAALPMPVGCPSLRCFNPSREVDLLPAAVVSLAFPLIPRAATGFDCQELCHPSLLHSSWIVVGG